MQTALQDLQLSLNRVRDIAAVVRRGANAALKSHKLMERHQMNLCAMTVTLSGLFESFLRDIAERYAIVIQTQNISFADLPKPIQHTHVAGGGKVLWNVGGKNVSGHYRWVLAGAQDITRRLNSVHSATHYELVWEAFA